MTKKIFRFPRDGAIHFSFAFRMRPRIFPSGVDVCRLSGWKGLWDVFRRLSRSTVIFAFCHSDVQLLNQSAPGVTTTMRTAQDGVPLINFRSPCVRFTIRERSVEHALRALVVLPWNREYGGRVTENSPSRKKPLPSHVVRVRWFVFWGSSLARAQDRKMNKEFKIRMISR